MPFTSCVAPSDIVCYVCPSCHKIQKRGGMDARMAPIAYRFPIDCYERKLTRIKHTVQNAKALFKCLDFQPHTSILLLILYRALNYIICCVVNICWKKMRVIFCSDTKHTVTTLCKKIAVKRYLIFEFRYQRHFQQLPVSWAQN